MINYYAKVTYKLHGKTYVEKFPVVLNKTNKSDIIGIIQMNHADCWKDIKFISNDLVIDL